ncbi:MAG: hypothetical protein AAGJ46_15610 [Planctomycetota bacterium]
MDQVRVALTWLKEQHFWVLTVLTLIVALACWYLAAGALQEQFTKNKSAIDSEFSAQRSRQNEPFHANDAVNERTGEEIKLLAEKVERVWTKLYDRQREEALQWPTQLDAGVDPKGSNSFLRHVSDKSFGDFIANEFRDRYLNYIQKRYPDLPKIIKALEVDDENGRQPNFDMEGEGGFGGGRRPGARGGGFGGDGDEEFVEEKEFLVVWRDQLAVKQQLVMAQRPSAIRIWVTQEDLWVYETLLKAIAATNTAAGADRYRNAAVREIYQMSVGAKAAGGSKTQQRIFKPSGEAAGVAGGGGFGEGGFGEGGFGEGGFGEGGFGGGGFGEGGFGEGGFGGGGFGEGGAAAGGELTALLTGRYVDDAGEPVPAPTVVTPGQPLQIGSAEYKQLPIRLVLKMDQRWVPQLIVELANAPLQVVVNEARINPTADVSSGGGFGGPGGGFGGGGVNVRTTLPRALQLAGRGGAGGAAGGGFGGGGGLGQNQEVFAFPREPSVATVVLNGTIFIFNPPDASVLSTGDDGGMVASSF